MTGDGRQARAARVAVCAVVCLAARVVLARDFPVVLTNDSWDFLGAARGIAERGDFAERAVRFNGGGVGLGDCRLPGYPVFQAMLLPLTGMQTDRILWAQSALGMVGVWLGWAIGRILRSPRTSIGLALFLGLNPVYLMNEHAVMSEGLSLVGVLLYALACLSLTARGLTGATTGAALGALFGLNLLVRLNAGPFCAMLTLGAWIVSARREPEGRRKARAAAFALAWLVATAATVAPWVARNHALFDSWTMNAFHSRALLVYKAMHPSFAPNLRRLRARKAEVGLEAVSYPWALALTERRGVAGAEAVCGDLLREQWRRRPLRHLRDSAVALACFGGYYESRGGDRDPIRYWFEHLARDSSAVDRLYEQSRPLASQLGLTYVPGRGDSQATLAWAWLGTFYLVVLRPVLYASALCALAASRWHRRSAGPRGATLGESAVLWLGLGLLATALFHAATLTDSDRFASLYDWAAAAVVLTAMRPRRED